MKHAMNQTTKLQSYHAEADVHAQRLQIALKHLYKATPFTVESLESISDENLAFLDLLSTRFNWGKNFSNLARYSSGR